MSIDRYVVTLRAHLSLSPARAAELAEEVRGHLEDAARDLQMAGLAPAESEREAVRRFGAPEEIGMAMTQVQKGGARRRAAPAVALLAAAAILVALGGNAVASAHTTPQPARSARTSQVMHQATVSGLAVGGRR